MSDGLNCERAGIKIGFDFNGADQKVELDRVTKKNGFLESNFS